MARPSIGTSAGSSWLQDLFRPVRPEALSAEQQYDYTHFTGRVRSFIIVKAAVNAALAVLFLFTVVPETPAPLFIALADGLLLIPYAFAARRWPALSTLALLSVAAVAVSAADAATGYQTFTSGVLYVILVVGGATLLLDPRHTLVLTAAVCAILALTYLLELTGAIPVWMSLQTPRAVLRVLGLHILAIVSVGAISTVLTRLYRQLLQARGQHGLAKALLNGFEEISANLELSTLLQRLAERAVAAIPAVERAQLLIEEEGRMVVRGSAGYAPLDPVGTCLSMDTIGPYLREEPTLVTDMGERIRRGLPDDAAWIQQVPTSRATLMVPLQVRGSLRVLLAVTNLHRADVFDDETRHMVDLFAHQAGAAIESARLYDTARVRLQEQLVLSGIGQDIARQLRMPDLVPAIYEHIRQVMDAPSFLIALSTAEDSTLELLAPVDAGRLHASRPIPAGGVLGWVIRHQRPLCLRDYERDLAGHPEIRQLSGRSAPDVRSLLAVPLRAGDEVIGALSVQSPQPDAYGEREEQFLVALASYIAVAIQNARLYDQVQAHQAELQGLISSFSERLQAPVEALAGFARLLREGDGAGLSSEQADYLARIERNSRWIADLVEDMLLLSRIDQMREEQEPIALDTLLRGIATHLGLDGRDISLAAEDGRPTVQADPVLMWAFFRNLLQNVGLLSDSEGRPRIAIGGEPCSEGYRISIRARGQVLSAEQLAHVFDLFFPIGGKDRPGVGLAIARRIGQLYGFKLWAEAVPGEGTVFHILLPRSLVQEGEASV